MKKTIVVKDERYIQHITMQGHPESPERLEAVYDVIGSSDINGCVEIVEPRHAAKDEIAMNHDAEYIDTVEATAGKSSTSLDPDTSTSAGSWEAANLAVGGVIKAIDLIMKEEAQNGFALVRPPGHHAEAGRAMGFCLFNNVAIGALHLIKKHGLERIAIVDWDLHHGNGTQNAFYSVPQVLYVSTHQYPYYPGSGSFMETGQSHGRGYTVNIPLPGGHDDDDYAALFTEIIAPVLKEYNPQFVLVSAGYDIYELDPLGTMNVTPEGFKHMTHILKMISETCCNGKLLLCLEGGYHIQGLAQSVLATLHALTGDGCPEDSDSSLASRKTKVPGSVAGVIQKVRQVHAETWTSLR